MASKKVLRIQHVKDASGPFTSDVPQVADIVNSVKLPQPIEDKGFNEEAINRLQDEKASPIKFAFRDEKQMGKVFSPEHLATLKEHGYEPTWVDAKDTWDSGNQVMYTTHEGDKAHANKLAEIKAKTKFKEYSPEEIKAMNEARKSDNLEKKLKELKELLEKNMSNKGLGGPGSIKAGAVLPSINTMTPKVGNNSKTPSVNPAQPSKKNPVKQAEQVQNKDIKDIKMKEAQATLALKKDEEVIKFDENGQWSLDKSGYKGYTDADNARRKANNLGEETGIHSMNRIKQYGGSGPNAAARDAAKMKAKSKKNPVKTFTPEEVEAENIKRGLTVKKTAREEIIETLEKGRCWEGYKPVKGKKPYEKGSCEPVSKEDIQVAPDDSNNRKTYQDEFEKEEKPFHGYNKDKHSKEGGMSAKAREKYNKETGGNLQKPVTSKEAKSSEKKANRRKSFCARMGGVKGPTSKDGKLTRKGAALKRWDC